MKYWTDIYPNIVVDPEYERDMDRFRDFILPPKDGGGGEPALLSPPRRKKRAVVDEEESKV